MVSNAWHEILDFLDFLISQIPFLLNLCNSPAFSQKMFDLVNIGLRCLWTPNFLGARDPESLSSGIFMEIHFVPTISLEEFDDSNIFMLSRYVTIEYDRGRLQVIFCLSNLALAFES